MNQSDTQTLYWLNRYWNLRNQVENENNRFIETIIMLRDQNSILKQKVEELEQENRNLKELQQIDPSSEDQLSEIEQTTVIEYQRNRRALSPIDTMPPSPPLRTFKSGEFTPEENKVVCEFVLKQLKEGKSLKSLGLLGSKGWEDFELLDRKPRSLCNRWTSICDNADQIKKFGMPDEDSKQLIDAIKKLKRRKGKSGSASSRCGSGGASFGSMITVCLTILFLFSGIASAAPSNSSSLLSQFATVSKDLGDISSITLKLDGMLKMETDLNTLIGGKQAIESAIGEVKDQKEQDRLKKMWTPENLAALQKNLATAEAVSDVVSKNKIVGNMTDFKAPFEKASEVQGCSIDIKRLASSLKGMIKDQTVATSLESSKNLDLQFVKYEQTRVGGVITGLQSYFDSVFGIKNTKTCDPGSSSCDAAPESSKLPPWAIYTIVIVCVVVFAAVVAGILVWLFCFYLKNKKGNKKTPKEIKEEEKAKREEEMKKLHKIKMTEQQHVEKVEKQDFYFSYFNPLIARPNAPPADGVKNVPAPSTKTVEEKKNEIMKDITHEDTVVKAEVPKKILEDNKPHIVRLLKQRRYNQARIDAFLEKLEAFWINFMIKTKIAWKRLATVPEALTPEMFFAPMINVEHPKTEPLAEKKGLGPPMENKNTLIIVGSNDRIIRNRKKSKDSFTRTGQSTKTSQSTRTCQSTKTSQSTKTVPAPSMKAAPSTKTSRPAEELGTARDVTVETDAKSARTAASISEKRVSSGTESNSDDSLLNVNHDFNEDAPVDKTPSENSLLTSRSSLDVDRDLEAGSVSDSSSNHGSFNCGGEPCRHAHTYEEDRKLYRKKTPKQPTYCEKDLYPKLSPLQELRERYENLETIQRISKRQRARMGPAPTSLDDKLLEQALELESLDKQIMELERAESAEQERLELEQQLEEPTQEDERHPFL